VKGKRRKTERKCEGPGKLCRRECSVTGPQKSYRRSEVGKQGGGEEWDIFAAETRKKRRGWGETCRAIHMDEVSGPKKIKSRNSFESNGEGGGGIKEENIFDCLRVKKSPRETRTYRGGCKGKTFVVGGWVGGTCGKNRHTYDQKKKCAVKGGERTTKRSAASKPVPTGKKSNRIPSRTRVGDKIGEIT